MYVQNCRFDAYDVDAVNENICNRARDVERSTIGRQLMIGKLIMIDTECVLYLRQNPFIATSFLIDFRL